MPVPVAAISTVKSLAGRLFQRRTSSQFSSDPRGSGFSQGPGFRSRNWPKPWANKTRRNLSLSDGGSTWQVKPGGIIYQYESGKLSGGILSSRQTFDTAQEGQFYQPDSVITRRNVSGQKFGVTGRVDIVGRDDIEADLNEQRQKQAQDRLKKEVKKDRMLDDAPMNFRSVLLFGFALVFAGVLVGRKGK